MIVRPAQLADAAQWLELRSELWRDGRTDHEDEIRRYFTGGLPGLDCVLLAQEPTRAVGLAELSIRFYAEGCRSGRVAYLEGWYVRPEAQKAGVGRALIEASEQWARSEGCTEFASDARPDNHEGVQAHLHCGFQDVGTIRCFRKPLSSQGSNTASPRRPRG